MRPINDCHRLDLSVCRDRFFAKVDKTDDCWLWTGTKNRKGYGRFWAEGRMYLAARISYVMAGFRIPDGLQLDHLCRNRGCVNPQHLEPVTNRENTIRGVGWPPPNQNVGKTHCIRGHEFTPENTVINRKGNRACRTCFNAWVRAKRKREKVAGIKAWAVRQQRKALKEAADLSEVVK